MSVSEKKKKLRNIISEIDEDDSYRNQDDDEEYSDSQNLNSRNSSNQSARS